MRAHPRVSGENAFLHGGMVGDRGSSPRERGKLVRLDSAGARVGLIPA